MCVAHLDMQKVDSLYCVVRFLNGDIAIYRFRSFFSYDVPDTSFTEGPETVGRAEHSKTHESDVPNHV